MWCFACPAHCNITHRNDRHAKSGGFKQALIIEEVPDPYNHAVQPGKRDQDQFPLKPGCFIHALFYFELIRHDHLNTMHIPDFLNFLVMGVLVSQFIPKNPFSPDMGSPG